MRWFRQLFCKHDWDYWDSATHTQTCKKCNKTEDAYMWWV